MKLSLDSAWRFQGKIEKKLFGVVSRFNLRLCDYFLFVSLVFFISGFSLFMYVFLFGYNILELDVLSSPLFYLVNGFMFMVFFVLQKRYCFFSGVIEK